MADLDTPMEGLESDAVEAPEIVPDLMVDYPEPDDLKQDDFAPRVIGEDGQIEGDETDNDAPMTNKTFRVALKSALTIPAGFSPDWKPLAIQPNETEMFNEAADGLFELVQIWAPSLLVPDSPTVQAIIKAMPLFLMKAMVVREILAARNSKPVIEGKADEPAPEAPQESPVMAEQAFV